MNKKTSGESAKSPDEMGHFEANHHPQPAHHGSGRHSLLASGRLISTRHGSTHLPLLASGLPTIPDPPTLMVVRPVTHDWEVVG